MPHKVEMVQNTDLKDIYDKLGNVPCRLEMYVGGDDFEDNIDIYITLPVTLKMVQKLTGCLNVED